MTSVEEQYAERIARMTPVERIERAEAMRRWSRDFIVRSIRAEHPDISDHDLRWELAMRLYGSDPRFRAWALERRDRASR